MIHIPQHFAELDTTRLQALIRERNFGTLVSAQQGEIQVSLLPFLLNPEGTRLRAHMARGNPQWRTFSQAQEVVVIFHGPHHYISPSWYAVQPSVPTWNYAVVHVQGRPVLIQDRRELEGLVRELVEVHETGSAAPWQMDLPTEYREKMISGIVGFEIEITRLEGKFKLSQNRPADDRPRVIKALQQIGNDDALGVAALMRENLARG